MTVFVEPRTTGKDVTAPAPLNVTSTKLGREDERDFALSLLKHPGEPVLDVGTGDCACITSILVSKGMPVVAIDKDDSTVRAARRFLDRRHSSKSVRLLQDDIAASKLPSGRFCNIVCFNVLHHVPEFENALAELHRILRLDGRLIISEFDENRDGFLGRLQRAVDRYFRHVTPYHRRKGRLVLSCEK
jgi:ubiquinone/menaquinone biosynthesis C-methylase UbiE